MSALEKEGLIYQPHTSAGRVPTDLGYRKFIDDLSDYEKEKENAINILKEINKQYKAQKARNNIYDAVELISRTTNNVSFATLPDNDRTFYLGIANVLKQPEFLHDSIRASQIIEVLEKNDKFINTLKQLEIPQNTTKIFIGKENILEQIQSCSIIVTKYKIENFTGFLGILGPTRMNYSFNKAIVEEVTKLIQI